MDLSDAVLDQDTYEPFTVQRSQGGQFGPSGWVDKYTTLNKMGVISIASPREVAALPEGDRIHEAIVINCTDALFVTRTAGSTGPATSDIVIWTGNDLAPGGQYRVMKTHNYASRGYWWAIAVRMAGN
jgi:hypothetical protein